MPPPIFTTALTDVYLEHDRVQILLRNAYQILDVVKASFPNPAFDNPLAELKCQDPSSSGHELACKWRKVTDKFMAMEGFKPKSEDISPFLIDVSIMVEITFHMGIVTRC